MASPKINNYATLHCLCCICARSIMFLPRVDHTHPVTPTLRDPPSRSPKLQVSCSPLALYTYVYVSCQHIACRDGSGLFLFIAAIPLYIYFPFLSIQKKKGGFFVSFLVFSPLYTATACMKSTRAEGAGPQTNPGPGLSWHKAIDSHVQLPA